MPRGHANPANPLEKNPVSDAHLMTATCHVVFSTYFYVEILMTNNVIDFLETRKVVPRTILPNFTQKG